MLIKLRRRFNEEEKGFTLIELLVVILIIGILAAIALPTFLGQRAKGQDSSAKSDARNLVSQVESCYVQNQTYVGCQTASELSNPGGSVGIDLGTGAGQAEVSAVGVSTYTIVGHSRSGNNFTISKSAGGAISRTCTDTGKAGCPSSGNW